MAFTIYDSGIDIKNVSLATNGGDNKCIINDINNFIKEHVSPFNYKYYNFITENCIDIKDNIIQYAENILERASNQVNLNEYINKWGRVCFYCFEPWTYKRKRHNIGQGRSFRKYTQNMKNFSIDRFDNAKTYSIDNIVFCCTNCNSSKNRISIKLIKRLNEVIKERGL